jgi:hypothetical protein
MDLTGEMVMDLFGFLLDSFQIVAVKNIRARSYQRASNLHEAYTNSAVSARLIVVLCCTISCNSFFAFSLFSGHANAATAASSLCRFDF